MKQLTRTQRINRRIDTLHKLIQVDIKWEMPTNAFLDARDVANLAFQLHPELREQVGA